MVLGRYLKNVTTQPKNTKRSEYCHQENQSKEEFMYKKNVQLENKVLKTEVNNKKHQTLIE